MTDVEPPDGWPTIVRLPLLPSPAEMEELRAQRRSIETQLEEQSAAAVHSVAECAAALGQSATALDQAVANARAAGATWVEIGRAAGISRQAAMQRWGAK